ncbi:MAG: tetratricopeptide repeat protein, partial [Acidobacteriota bacterium]
MSDPPHTLTAGQPLERELEGGGAHTYELELDAGRFVSVAVEQRGIDVFLRFYSPSGELLTEVDSPTGTTGTERVRAVAGAAGTHRLEVRSFEGVRKPGRYTVEIEESREATGDDRTRVAAERAFAEGETLRREGRYTDAESRYEQALDAWGSLEDRPGVAEALYRIGWVRGELGDALGAVDFLRDALADYRELGDRKQVAVTLNRLGANLARLGRLKEADEHLREALELATEIDEAVLRTSAAILLGNLHKWSGRTEEALRLYESALETADPWVVATIRYHIGDVYLARNDADAARLSLEQALEEARASGNRETEAFGLFKLGEALRRLDRLDAAEERLEDALALQRERGDRWGEAMTLDNLGTVLLQAGRLDDARRAFERGLEISTELGDLHGQALSRSKLGRYHHAAGDPERARADHETALPLFERTGDRQGVASSRYGIARALYETGDFEGAREALETALKDAESLRAESQSHALRASYLASRRHHWDLYVNTLMRLHEADPGGGFDRLALQAAERWRARGLLDLLAEADVELLQGAPEKLLKEEHRLRRELDGIERRRMEVLGRSDRTVDERTVAELEERQTRRLLDLDRVRSEIRRTSGRYRELTDPNPLRLGEIQGELLDRDTALLVYFLGEERSAVWVVSRSGVESRVLPDRETIEAAARDFHSLLPRISARAADARRRAGERLSELILGPVAGLLDAKRLAVVADGGLQVLPFAALPVPTAAEEAGSGEILLDRHEVVHLPSASVLGALRRLEGSGERAPRTVAVIADPVFGPDDPRIAGGPTGPGTGAGTGSGVEPGTDPELGRALRSFGPGGLERLPHTEDEALAIAGLAPEGSSLQALGFEADRSLLDRGKLADYRIVHFATHGLLHPRHPELSGLVLSLYDREGAPRDGFLRLHDV